MCVIIMINLIKYGFRVYNTFKGGTYKQPPPQEITPTTPMRNCRL
jgi:hypothetical protein